jgi:hypothetical protein
MLGENLTFPQQDIIPARIVKGTLPPASLSSGERVQTESPSERFLGDGVCAEDDQIESDEEAEVR